jgi:drug/metabolite transporter (DMT)-like permease
MTRSTRHRQGLGLAFAAACISGVTVFLNGYAVKHVHVPPVAYTTLKNLVAAVVLGGLAASAGGLRPGDTPRRAASGARWLALAFVGIAGGGVAFALFFEGLAKTSSTDAAFTQKSLVVWVALLAVPLLHERVGPAQLVAVGLLVAGSVELAGGVRGLSAGKGELLILAATMIWAVEVILVKGLLGWLSPLAVGVARMGIGAATLFAWLALTGGTGSLAHLGAGAWSWVVLTGGLLAVYVGVWFAALRRAQAVDVTAVLILGAFVTALLDTWVQGSTLPGAGGLVLVSVGTTLVAAAWRRAQPEPAEVTRA